jgi:hypothetical protein
MSVENLESRERDVQTDKKPTFLSPPITPRMNANNLSVLFTEFLKLGKS